MDCFLSRQAEFHDKIRSLDASVRLEQLFLYSASPILGGVRPSELVALRGECAAIWDDERERLCDAVNLSALCLQRSWDFALILIYDKARLSQCINERGALELLRNYGYFDAQSTCTFSAALANLCKRFAERRDFPHEIGIFLGYPPDDVAAFIEKKGRDCVCCRYWKVYHNPERANAIFRCIDRAKSHALTLIDGSVPLEKAAVLLRAG